MNDPSRERKTPIADINFLSSSWYRVEILETFVEAGSLTRRDIRESVDASRSTVRRTLEGLVQRGLIESTDAGYRITVTGEIVANGFMQLVETIQVTREYSPLFRWLPRSALDIDPNWLRGGTMTVSTETNPYAPAQRQTETVQGADSFDGVLPAIELEGTKIVHERITSGTLTARIIVPDAMLETIRSDSFSELFREQIATGRLDLLVHGDPLPLYLGLPDEKPIEIGGMDDEGIPRVLFQSTRSELRRWGERTFERYRDEAVRIGVADL